VTPYVITAAVAFVVGWLARSWLHMGNLAETTYNLLASRKALDDAEKMARQANRALDIANERAAKAGRFN
jgi:hypothetical protein